MRNGPREDSRSDAEDHLGPPPGLPAFLTAPVRQPISMSADEADTPASAPAPGATEGMNGQANEPVVRTRRRRTRIVAADQTEADLGQDGTERPPAAE